MNSIVTLFGHSPPVIQIKNLYLIFKFVVNIYHNLSFLSNREDKDATNYNNNFILRR